MRSLSFHFSPSDTKQDDTFQYLLCLIAERKWKSLRKILQAPMEYDENNCQAECDSKKCFPNHTLLHFACQFQPPLFIVQELVTAFPDSVFQVNCMKQYPLHVAVEHVAPVPVINYLLETNEQAPMARDIEGKTPFHLLFHDYLTKKQSSVGIFGSRYNVNIKLLQIIRSLFRAAPLSVMVEDVKGISVLEYAIEGEADLKIVQKLQKVTMQVAAMYKSAGDVPNFTNREVAKSIFLARD